ncbi:SDR family oxidoreductase [Demequina sp. TTPB684]|nr:MULTISPECIES: SDR family oxidoreductase [unclassified Demequina]MCB2413062.1 SDR family oxidoreductase [Demequina sp. TTPB684]UPU89765.1 SDR family oxidoreductase [Demequina sp. TMPB413]
MKPAPDLDQFSYSGRRRLLGRRALITGADSATGRAVSTAFAKEGANVAMCFSGKRADMSDTLRVVEQAGRKAMLLPGDTSHERDCVSVVNDAAVALGGLDLLVMISDAHHTVGHLELLDTTTLDLVMRTNVYSLFWLTRAALPHLKAGAAIITTSSVQATRPAAPSLEGAMTHAEIANFTRTAAQQLGHRRIRVNAVAPGGNAPGKRTPHLAELASAYVYLASQGWSETSGETVVVHGGKQGRWLSGARAAVL